MKRIARLQRWYRNILDKRRARHLGQPQYPFAGTVGVLRRTVQRIGRSTPQAISVYCEGLPANVFCRIDSRSAVWWILNDDMLWMVQVDRSNLNMAFAACSDLHAEAGQSAQRMCEVVKPLYATSALPAVSWEERLVQLGKFSSRWMRRNRPGTCLPGLVVFSKSSALHQTSAHALAPHDPIRTARRLEQPQRLEVAVPLIVHSLWSDLRQENMSRAGHVADAWQLACALVDNPWESWQTVRSGRLN